MVSNYLKCLVQTQHFVNLDIDIICVMHVTATAILTLMQLIYMHSFQLTGYN